MLVLLQGLAFVLDLFQVEKLSEQMLKLQAVEAPPQLPELNAARLHCREKLGPHYLQKQFLQWLGLKKHFLQSRAQ